MIQLQGAGKRFGHKLLFEGCDWLITPANARVSSAPTAPANRRCSRSCAARNRSITAQISFTKGMTIGYLPQDGLALSGRTVFQNA